MSMMSELQVIPIPALTDNYIWAIIHNNKAIIVDPGEAAPVNAFLKQHHLILQGILLTHHHWDHTNAAPELSEHYQVPIIGPKADNIACLTKSVKEGDLIEIAEFPMKLKVLDIPGHTLGHIAYVGEGALFCGDTLFSAGCGRLFEGTAEQMYHSLQKLAALPPDTKVYCGHEYTLNNLRFAKTVEPNNTAIVARIAKVTQLKDQHTPSLPSTIKDELAANPFLRCQAPEVIASVKKHTGNNLTTPVEIFSALRKWKDTF